MDKGATMWRVSIISDDPFGKNSWISEGVVSGLEIDGVPLIRMEFGALEPMSDKWHESRVEARRAIHREMVRHIGRLQAIADETAAEILHEDLTTEAA